jgi:NADH-quinone oxidoreductase subunit L
LYYLREVLPLTELIIPYLALAVLLLPFLSFISLFFLARSLKRKGERLATWIMFIDFILALCIFLLLKNEPPAKGIAASYLTVIPWFDLASSGGTVNFTISILINTISSLMLLIVTFISLLVHFYSIEYMRGKRNYERYFSYLAIFTFSMLGIVISDNLLITFMFWELVGFSSYLIIGFWFDKESAVKASKKAFLFNRIGDLGFLVALFIFYAYYNTLELSQIKHVTEIIPSFWLSIAGIGLFAACAGKSAQFPLQVWLPDAMEGPTPASALIHAATMVAAGVYLLAKVFFLLPEEVKTIIAITGAVTAFAGALPALVQNDIKKVLAYSTISQLGYMVMGMGFNGYEASFFHLTTHAFFKAGLFLAAGSVIHTMHHIKHALFLEGTYISFDAQDMRLMGGLAKKMPIAFSAYLICALSLIGVPFFSGFLSKEMLLENAWAWAVHKQYEGMGSFYFLVPVLAYATLFITTIYMSRQLYLIFFGKFRLGGNDVHIEKTADKIHEHSLFINLPLILLSTCSLWFVFSLNPFNGYSGWFYKTLSPLIRHGHFDVVPVLVMISGFGVFLLLKNKFSVLKGSVFSRVLANNWYLDWFYYRTLVVAGFQFSYLIARVDKKIIDPAIHLFAIVHVIAAHVLSWTDRVLVDGVISSVVYLSGQTGRLTKSLQSGRVQHYFLVVVIVLIGVMGWYCFIG